MDPATWLVVFLIVSVLVALIASKKGRSGIKLWLSMVLAAPAMMVVASWALGNNIEGKNVAMSVAAYGCLFVGFIWALSTKNKDQLVAEIGTYGGMRKCPFCAEAIRAEAVKCKHCGSELPTAVAAE